MALDYPQEGALPRVPIPGAANIPWAWGRRRRHEMFRKTLRGTEAIYALEAGL